MRFMPVTADKFWIETAKFLATLRCAPDRIIAPGQFRSLLPGVVAYEQKHLSAAPEAVVLHKGMLEKLGPEWIERITADLQPTFGNEVFVVFSSSHPHRSIVGSIHFTAYLKRLELLISRQKTARVVANQAVDQESIRWACRLLLLREPESENEIQSYLQCPDVRSLQRALLASPEFRSLQRAAVNNEQVVTNPDVPCTFFMHIPKTGGTTLHGLLASHYPESQICPERHNHLTNLTIGELSTFRLFSGHFDWSSINLIPAQSRRIVTILRDPARRLLSMYRFLRAHDPNYARASSLDRILLANEYTAEVFFRQPSVRASPWFNNGMVRACGHDRVWTMGKSENRFPADAARPRGSG
jgi:Sulfotransferase family